MMTFARAIIWQRFAGEQAGPTNFRGARSSKGRRSMRPVRICWLNPFRWAALAVVLFAGCVAGAANTPGSITWKPLKPHPFPRGKTMFVRLPPEQTGVRTTNNFADPRMKGDLYQELETSSVGTGVAIGDYDGDGLPDIFVVSKTESCRLFRNLGNFKFEDVTEKAGVGDHGADAMIWKQGATFVDVNNDGLLDIYVCRARAPNLLYINQGDGTFKEEAHAYGLDVNDSSVMAYFCDYDRDGWLDVYIATNILDIVKHPDGQRGYLFHNNHNGTFTNVTVPAGIVGDTQTHSADWWDYDNDGWPDLYVAYDYGLPDSLYHNNRDGTFTNVIDRVVPHTSFSSMGSDVGDVNNDGRIDLFVADMAGSSHEAENHMTADFRARTPDLPNDSTAAPKYHRNALLLNTGTGHCLEGSYLAGISATDWTWSPRFEDLDNDGRLDLFVTNGFPRDPSTDVQKRLMGAETPAARIRIMYATPELDEVHMAFRNLGDLKFKNVSADWGLDHKGVSFGTAFGDLYGDGNLDIVYANYHHTAYVYRNDNDTGHRVMIDLRGTVSNRFGIGAMVRIESALGVQASQLWLGRGYMSSSEPAVHFGLGKDTVIKRLTVTWPSGLVQTFTDLPVDRRYMITEPAGPAPVLSRKEKPLPAGEFSEVGNAVGLSLKSREEVVDELAQQRLLPIRLNRRGPALAVGDTDGSGADTVVVGGTTRDALRVLHGDASGRFSEVEAPAMPSGADVDEGPVLLFDATGNGRSDLLVTKGGNSLAAGDPEYQPRLFLNDGHGRFLPAPDDALPSLPISAGAAVAADFEHTGRLGLFIGGRVLPGEYPLPPQSELLVNRGGKFEDVTDSLAPGLRNVGMVTSALWSDVDGDGWPDLLLTLEWGNVKYFHNNQGKGFEDWTEKAGFAAAGTGWWNSIAAADFNGDGRMDYVVGNLGLNTQYHADPAHPALLFSGDFKGDGSTQLVEGFYEGDKLYPWRIVRDLGAAIPSVLKRYPTFDLFGRATLDQIFGKDKLARAQRFAATQFRSGVFLSQPDGTYKFEPLPRIAQISPFQGLAAGYFDGNECADIYAVQNSYAPIAYVGRFDGGISQFLKSDGHGHFSPVEPAKSGLVVTGDAKALAVLDLNHDGWPDFLVTQNNNVTLAFKNRAVPGRHSFSIQLRGSAGNPTAVGSRITVALADGTIETAEVYAGSGYYSQSTPACFFGYPDSNPPKSIHVRWPDGKTSEQAAPSGVSRLMISMPAH